MYGFFVDVYFYASYCSSTCIWVGLKLVPSFVIHSREVIWLAKGWPFEQHLHVVPVDGRSPRTFTLVALSSPVTQSQTAFSHLSTWIARNVSRWS